MPAFRILDKLDPFSWLDQTNLTKKLSLFYLFARVFYGNLILTNSDETRIETTYNFLNIIFRVTKTTKASKIFLNTI